MKRHVHIKTFESFDDTATRPLQDVSDYFYDITTLLREVDSGDVSGVKLLVSQDGKTGEINLSDVKRSRNKALKGSLLGLEGVLSDSSAHFVDLRPLVGKKVNVSFVYRKKWFDLVLDWGQGMAGVTIRYKFVRSERTRA